MNLAIDIGNTRTKVGLFEGGQLYKRLDFDAFSKNKIMELATNHNAQNIIFSSVALSLSKEEEEEIRRSFSLLILSTNTALPIQNLYHTPETLGKDRIAAVVGAHVAYPGRSCLVVDAGTCITYDLLMDGERYLGGNIAPGIKMRLKAMHTFTASLPDAPLSSGQREWIGKDTISALQNGAELGALLEAEGFIRYCEEKLGEITVIFTGGNADFFAKHLKRQIFVNQNLVLIGLNKIIEHNV
jgi:type III pantothenate kinase